MKKIITACLSIGLTFTPLVVKAFETSALAREGVIDNCIRRIEDFKYHYIHEGITHLYINGNLQGAKMGVQWEHPILKTMVSDKRLSRLRVELNLQDTAAKETYSKLGFLSRHIVKPNSIMGWHTSIHLPTQNSELPYLTDLGLEWIIPPISMSLYGLCSPFSLLRDESLSYQASLKLALIKPRVLDLFTAFSVAKNSQYDKKWIWTIAGIKSQVPISKLDLKQWVTVGGDLSYIVKEKWISRDNFTWSIYLQLNLVKNKPQNSLRDYLRMPTDQYATNALSVKS